MTRLMTDSIGKNKNQAKEGGSDSFAFADTLEECPIHYCCLDLLRAKTRDDTFAHGREQLMTVSIRIIMTSG